MKKTQGITHQSRVRKIVVGGLIGATSLAFGLGIVGPTSDADAAVVCDGPLLNPDTTCQRYSGDCWQFATPDMYCYDHLIASGGDAGTVSTPTLEDGNSPRGGKFVAATP